MPNSSILAVSDNQTRKDIIIANLTKVKEKAKDAFSNGRSFTFPSVTSIIGNPPILPPHSNIYKILEESEELSSYYEVAAYIEGEFSKIIKEKRA